MHATTSIGCYACTGSASTVGVLRIRNTAVSSSRVGMKTNVGCEEHTVTLRYVQNILKPSEHVLHPIVLASEWTVPEIKL